MKPTRLQESYRQITGQGQTNASTTVQQGHQSAAKTGTVQKVMVQLDPDKNIWTPAEIVQCTRNRRFIKPDQTEHFTPTQELTMEQRVTRPTRTIQKPDRLIESK